MVFSSPTFVFYFLPLTLLLYYLSPRLARNGLLVAVSLIFYTWGAGKFTALLLLSVAVNYAFGLALGAIGGERLPLRRMTLAAGIVFNLAVLAYFKYANFFVFQLNDVGHRLEWGEIAWNNVILPIGISFYTFHAMSYVIDVFRQRVAPLRNPLDFALYITFFPQMIAGPIVRFNQIDEQIRRREETLDKFAEGVLRFVHGLIKKIIIADPLGVLANAAFSTPPDNLTMLTAWIGVATYTFQIYFDFSGYSDMAIGLARMFGFRFPENFNRPYSSVSITDFWRRWHMTLSGWFRDYLYIPLGGDRISPARTYANLLIVFLATGIWHGANWTFILWGAYHGVFLLIERITGLRYLDDETWQWPRRIATFFIVMMGWVLFRSEDLAQAGQFYSALVKPHSLYLSPELALAATWKEFAILALASLVAVLPRNFNGGAFLAQSDGRWAAPARAAILLVVFPYAIVEAVGATFSPFLYFQF
jgi:alginate O-acetyltransferase complex protein AlgI